ncbi:MAG: J domain-containing protein [Candidatus Binatia bacterium]
MMRWLFTLALLWVLWRMLRAALTAASAPRRAPAAEPAGDPYRVLGVSRGASADELAQAYRDRMKEYHPDRVADLGPELQELAHRKTVEIQHAWDTLRPNPAGRRGSAG